MDNATHVPGALEAVPLVANIVDLSAYTHAQRAKLPPFYDYSRARFFARARKDRGDDAFVFFGRGARGAMPVLGAAAPRWRRVCERRERPEKVGPPAGAAGRRGARRHRRRRRQPGERRRRDARAARGQAQAGRRRAGPAAAAARRRPLRAEPGRGACPRAGLRGRGRAARSARCRCLSSAAS